MKTITKIPIYNILKLFYKNRNISLHLRDIARKIKLNESSTSRHLNSLIKSKILQTKKDGNLKKFKIVKIKLPFIFSMYDEEMLNNLPLLRRKAINEYIKRISKKPIFIIIFGSTAKGTFRNDSDLDIVEVYNSKTDNIKAQKYCESQTGIRLNVFQLNYKNFQNEIHLKKDKTIQSAINTGFPVFNQKYYWENIYYE